MLRLAGAVVAAVAVAAPRCPATHRLQAQFAYRFSPGAEPVNVTACEDARDLPGAGVVFVRSDGGAAVARCVVLTCSCLSWD